MKKYILIIIFSITSLYVKSEIHVILVWNGYYQFMPSSLNINLGDTIHFLPLDPPLMAHTITSSNIPIGANSFDQIWQAPADTFFQYIPQVEGFYEYVCTPHISFGMIGSFNVINRSWNSTCFSFKIPTAFLICFVLLVIGWPKVE